MHGLWCTDAAVTYPTPTHHSVQPGPCVFSLAHHWPTVSVLTAGLPIPHGAGRVLLNAGDHTVSGLYRTATPRSRSAPPRPSVAIVQRGPLPSALCPRTCLRCACLLSPCTCSLPCCTGLVGTASLPHHLSGLHRYIYTPSHPHPHPHPHPHRSFAYITGFSHTDTYTLL